MKNIETLTAAERRDLVQLGDRRVCKKTLRIIDAQAAALAESRAECDRLREEQDMAEKTLRYDYQRAAGSAVWERARATAAESKLAAAEAALERAACRMPEVDYPLWWEAYRAFLASAQPAVRTEAERRYREAVEDEQEGQS